MNNQPITIDLTPGQADSILMALAVARDALRVQIDTASDLSMTQQDIIEVQAEIKEMAGIDSMIIAAFKSLP